MADLVSIYEIIDFLSQTSIISNFDILVADEVRLIPILIISIMKIEKSQNPNFVEKSSTI